MKLEKLFSYLYHLRSVILLNFETDWDDLIMIPFSFFKYGTLKILQEEQRVKEGQNFIFSNKKLQNYRFIRSPHI